MRNLKNLTTFRNFNPEYILRQFARNDYEIDDNFELDSAIVGWTNNASVPIVYPVPKFGILSGNPYADIGLMTHRTAFLGQIVSIDWNLLAVPTVSYDLSATGLTEYFLQRGIPLTGDVVIAGVTQDGNYFMFTDPANFFAPSPNPVFFFPKGTLITISGDAANINYYQKLFAVFSKADLVSNTSVLVPWDGNYRFGGVQWTAYNGLTGLLFYVEPTTYEVSVVLRSSEANTMVGDCLYSCIGIVNSGGNYWLDSDGNYDNGGSQYNDMVTGIQQTGKIIRRQGNSVDTGTYLTVINV